MGERPTFGIDTPKSIQRAKRAQATDMFPDGEDLPLFSGTPIKATEKPFVPEDLSMKQAMLPEMPGIDYDRVLQADKARRRRIAPVVPAEGIFSNDPVLPEEGE